MSEEALQNTSQENSETFGTRLEKFEKVNTFASLRVSEDRIKEILSWNDDLFASSTKERLKYYQHWINRYIMHLSDVYSHHFARASLLEKKINIDAASVINDLLKVNKFLSYDERKNLAISENEDLLALYNLYIEHEMYSNRVLKLIYSITEMMKRLDTYVK